MSHLPDAYCIGLIEKNPNPNPILVKIVIVDTILAMQSMQNNWPLLILQVY